MSPDSKSASRTKTYVGYVLMLAVTVGIYLVVRNHGEALSAPGSVEAPLVFASEVPPNVLLHVLLLPAFFAFTGMRTQIGLLGSASDWFYCLVIVAVACLGKFGGSAVAARLSGLGWQESAALGTLMNTRGLMELIVLNIGLELGVISPTLFAMLVLMALATTMMTSPILAWLAVGPRRSV